MSHHVARLIAEAEAAPTDVVAQEAAAAEVLKLWQHRAMLPGPNQPLQSFDAVFRGLAKLDPERPGWDRFHSTRGRHEFDGPARDLVEAAVAIDGAAARAVRSLIKRAATVAANHEKIWLEATLPQPEDDPLTLFFEKLDVLGYGATSDEARPPVPPEATASLDGVIQAAANALAALQSQLDGQGARPDRGSRDSDL